MKMRVTGAPEDIKALIGVLDREFNTKISEIYNDESDLRFNVVYIDVFTKDRTVNSTIQDYQVIEYCNKFRSKNEVRNYFDISFEAAAEILDRLADEGALFKYLDDKKYIYVDARYLPFVKKRCGNCEHRSFAWGECYKGVKPDDLPRRESGSVYIPVNHAPCDKYDYSASALYEVIKKEIYQKFKGGE